MRVRTLGISLALGRSAAAVRAATFTVTSTADAGAGTLRQAITDANNAAGGDTIAFNIVGAARTRSRSRRRFRLSPCGPRSTATRRPARS